MTLPYNGDAQETLKPAGLLWIQTGAFSEQITPVPPPVIPPDVFDDHLYHSDNTLGAY